MFYRKYRPQTWEDLDNVRIRETLGKAVMDNNWSHAYLLLGSRGTGKTTTARLIAKTVNCLNRKKGEEPCNRCDSCLGIINGSSLDVIEIDAASNTGVDDIRDLREKVRLSPTLSKFKIYIIDEVHMLSTSAFNALLKTLEEPPSHVIFVLATTDPQKLPDTIISRCLVYDFALSSFDEIKKKLVKIIDEEKIKIDEETIDLIAKKAKGSHRDAQKLLEQLTTSGAKGDLAHLDKLNLNSDISYSKTILLALTEHNKSKALECIEKYVNQNNKIKDLIGSLISDLRDELLASNDKTKKEEVNLLIKKLIDANSLLRDCPIQSLPLELVIVEWCGDSVIATPSLDKGKQSSDEKEHLPAGKAGIAASPDVHRGPRNDNTNLDEIIVKWPEVVAATKPHNHSLNAFLRAAHPIKFEDRDLTIEVLYKFHKEKLEENKNRDILEQVVSDIMGNSIKVKFELKAPPATLRA